MNENPTQKKCPDGPEIALRIFICVLIILAGILVFIVFNLTKPERKRVRPEAIPTLVDVMRVTPDNRQVVVKVMGTVAAEQEINLKSTQSGEIVMVAPGFIPGGFFKKGEVIMKTDPADGLIAVRQKKAAVLSAKASLDIELGYQDVARQEVSLMEVTTGKKLEKNELALRKPQLDQAQAAYDAAVADLEAAELDYGRTIIRAPFNCMILTRSVNLGEHVAANTTLGTIAGTDAYWVEAAVPVDQLRWIRIPGRDGDAGSRAFITARYQREEESPYTGSILRLTGTLTEETRLATLIVRISDPLSRGNSGGRTPLILGSFVNADIMGRILPDLFSVPRRALRDNDTVWVLKEGRLDIRKIKAVWKGTEDIYISEGLEDGDALIISALSGPVAGMKLTENGLSPEKKDSEKKGAGIR